MLANIKLLLGITDNTKDSLITLLISRATEFAKCYTHNDDIATILPNSIEALVIWEYNHLGVEGMSSESYSGVDFSYETDYPQPLLRSLTAHRKVITV